MRLEDVAIGANGGAQIAAVAAAAGIDSRDMEALARMQIPRIAARIHRVAADDEAALEAIFDLLEDGEAEEYLQKPAALTSREAVGDGEDILGHIYGSPEEAERELAGDPPAGMSRELAARLAPFCAALTVAAMSRRYRAEVLPVMAAGGADSAGAAGGGIIALLIDAIIKGLVTALKRAFLPRRRRRRYSYRYRRNRRGRSRRSRSRSYRRRSSRRRRRRSTSVLEDIIGEAIRKGLK